MATQVNCDAVFPRKSRETAILIKVKKEMKVLEKDIVNDIRKITDRDGVTSLVKGRGPIYEVKFISEEVMNRFMEKFKKDEKYVYVRRCEPKCIMVTVEWVSCAMSDDELLNVIGQYAKIMSGFNEEAHPDFNNCTTGKKTILVERESMSPNFPSIVYFPRTSVLLSYEGQRRVCFRCGKAGHFRRDCTAVINPSQQTNNVQQNSLTSNAENLDQQEAIIERRRTFGNAKEFQQSYANSSNFLKEIISTSQKLRPVHDTEATKVATGSFTETHITQMPATTSKSGQGSNKSAGDVSAPNVTQGMRECIPSTSAAISSTHGCTNPPLALTPPNASMKTSYTTKVKPKPKNMQSRSSFIKYRRNSLDLNYTTDDSFTSAISSPNKRTKGKSSPPLQTPKKPNWAEDSPPPPPAPPNPLLMDDPDVTSTLRNNI